ncbi:unnamed protein product [Prunus armeniaca]
MTCLPEKTVWNFGVVLMRIECGERESEEKRLPLVFKDWSSLRDLGKHERLGKFGTSWAYWSTSRLGFVTSSSSSSSTAAFLFF